MLQYKTVSPTTGYTGQTNRQKWMLACLYFVLLFVANPFVCLIIMYIYLLAINQSYLLSILFCLLCGMFIGCVNATKIPENDLVWYIQYFRDAGKMGLSNYIASMNISDMGSENKKEFLFPVFNFILYRIVNGSVLSYITVLSAISYSLLNISIVKFGKAFKISKNIIILGIAINTFFPFIFTLSAHLLRQFLASAILMFVLTDWFFYRKKRWFLMVSMIFIHSTTLFFIPFILFSFFKKRISSKTIWPFLLIFSAIAGIQLLAKLGLNIFSSGGSTNSLTYALERASRSTTYELEALTTFKILVNLFLVGVTIYIIDVKRKFWPYVQGRTQFLNLFIFLVFFVLINLNQLELSVRFNFYVLQFIPFVLVLLFHYIRANIILNILIAVIMVIFFINYLHNGVWDYRSKDDLLLNSFFNYYI